ncbi:MAG: hypothetical protein DI606_00365 [Sphingobium sp.]|uniref:hypothetical protein n=1 Tax=Sphingobium sp. TaxID=1912891 RepID=UPI000DB8269F|nr:hypothetical protein [Sphingobium sp.]PZU15061.1 MAG: hypothetical protein DI606_00365 [Sphingobium sp.]
MPQPNEILAPAGFVPQQAVVFARPDGTPTTVNPANPLPVATAAGRAALSAPLSGSTGTGMMAGPFIPDLGREVILTLSGNFSGTVTLMRSVNGGASMLPATLAGRALAWTGALNEIVWLETEAAAGLYLQIAVSAGTLTYRVAQ